MEPIVFFSQNREDLILASFFPDIKNGFYVDVGAYHPSNDSVTKYFYDRGWSGINIEPQSDYFKLFQRFRKRDTNLNLGLSDSPGELSLRVYPTSGGLSTFSGSMKRTYSSKKEFSKNNHKDIIVKVDTLENVLDKHCGKKSIHFLKIDVEGFEYEVLNGNNWHKYAPEVICIEANHEKKDWHKLLDKNHYQLAFFDGLNEYFVNNHAKHRIQLFKKTFPNLLVSAPIISHDWKNIIDKLERTLEVTTVALKGEQKSLARLTEENTTLAKQNKIFQDQLNRFQSIKHTSKHLSRVIVKRIQKQPKT